MANTTFSQLTTNLTDPADNAAFGVDQGGVTQQVSKTALQKRIKTDVVLKKGVDLSISANAITLDVSRYDTFHVYSDSNINTVNVENLSNTYDTKIEINFQQNASGGNAINFSGITVRWQQSPTINTQANMISTVILRHRAGTNYWLGKYEGSVSTQGLTGTSGSVNNPPVVDNFIPNAVATEQVPYSYIVPANTFSDPDGDTLTYKSSSLSWLSFNANTRELSGTPTSSGTFAVTITATDPSGASVSNNFNIVIQAAPTSNSAPTVINPIPDSSISVGSNYIYTVPSNVFYDANGDTLTYTSNAAGWLSFNPSTQTFSGTPTAGNTGITTITVTAKDASNATATDQFTINVTPASSTNNAPQIVNTIGDTTATAGSPFNYVVSNTFIDPDGDTLTYSSSANGWLSFNVLTKTFTGTPQAGDIGIMNVTVTAEDRSNATVTDTFKITINPSTGGGNSAPNLVNPISDKTATTGSPFNYVVNNTFLDPDGDTLTYSSSASGWLVFNASTKTFTGTPQAGDAGIMNVTVTAKDTSNATATDTFKITITNPVAGNNAPTVSSPIPNQTATSGTGFYYQFPTNTFSDADGDVLTYTANTPLWLGFTPSTRDFSGLPTASDVGVISVTVTATDTSNAAVSDTFTITVAASGGGGGGGGTLNLANPASPATLSKQGLQTITDSGGNYLFKQDGTNIGSLVEVSNWLPEIPVGGSVSVTSTIDVQAIKENYSFQTAFIGIDAAMAEIGHVRLNDSVIARTITYTNTSGAPVTPKFRFSTYDDTHATQAIISNISYTTGVAGANNAPTIANPIVNQTAVEGVPFSFVVPANTFNDQDGDTLTYSATSNSGGWLSIATSTITFSGTPSAGTAGSTVAVSLKATDPSGLSATSTFNIYINNQQTVSSMAKKGINSNWVSGWDNPSYFVNLARYCGEWIDEATNIVATNQNKGKLVTDSATVNYKSIISHPTITRPAGNYTIRWTGNGQIGIGLNFPPSTMAYTSNKNITINLTSFTGMFVFFKGTNLDTLEIILPNMLAQYDAGNEWDPDYIAYINSLNITSIRAMNFVQASLFPGEDYAQLVQKTDISYTTNVPIEVLCDLAERTGTDLYYDGPARGTDACFNSIAQDFKAHLHANTTLFLEAIGNEVWNTASAWSGNTYWITVLGAPKYNVTTNPLTQTFTLNGHGLVNGDKIRMWITKNYGWDAAAQVKPWQGNSGVDLEVIVVNANEFKVKDKWSGQIVTGLIDKYPTFQISKESEATKNFHPNYTARSEQIWDIFKLHINSSRIKYVLGSQFGNDAVTQLRVNALTNHSTVNLVATAPYFWVGLYSIQLDVAGTNITPKIYSTEFNSIINVAIYPTASTPTIQDVMDGTGAIKHESYLYPGSTKTYRSINVMTGLTAGASYKCHAVFTDQLGMLNKLELAFSQNNGTYTVINEPNDLADREYCEIAIKIKEKHRKLVVAAKGIDLTMYEGGPHYSHPMPANIVDWLYNSYWKSTIAEQVYKHYLTYLSSLGFKNVVIYKDISTTRFGLATSIANAATDIRAKAFKSFGSSIPTVNIPVLEAPDITMGSGVSNGQDLTNYANTITSADPVTYSIALGDSDGLFSITSAGILRVGNKSKYDFAKNTTRVIGIKVTSSAMVIIKDQKFILGGNGGSTGGDTTASTGGGGGGGGSTSLNLLNPVSPAVLSPLGINPITETSTGTYSFKQDGTNASGLINVTGWLPEVPNGGSVAVTLTMDVVAIKLNYQLQALFYGVDAAMTTKVAVGLNDAVIARTMTFTNTSGAAVTPNLRIAVFDDTFVTEGTIANISYTTS